MRYALIFDRGGPRRSTEGGGALAPPPPIPRIQSLAELSERSRMPMKLSNAPATISP